MIKFGLEEAVIKSHGIHMIENLDTLPKVAVGVFSRHLFFKFRFFTKFFIHLSWKHKKQ